MEVKNGYKQTEVGVIPEEWTATPIGKLLEFKNGLNKAKGFFGKGTHIVNYMDVFEYPGLSISDIIGKVTVNGDEKRNYQVKQGDVFFTRTSETVEEIGMSSVMLEEIQDAVYSGFVLRGRPKNNILGLHFKKYCFRSEIVRKQITSTSSYTTRALTNGRLLSKIFLPLPPTLAEQTAIAPALYDFDALIKLLEKIMAKKRAIKRGALQELITGKKRLLGFGGNKEKYKLTELGVVPEDWQISKVKDIAQITTGSRNTQDRIDSGEYPFFVRSQIVERINSYSFDGEAVLTAGDGVGTGKVFHYIKGKFDLHQRVYKISDFKENVNGYYFFLFFSSNFYNRIMQMTAKSSVDSVRMEMIADMQIPFPPTLEEQTAIAAILTDMDAEIAVLESKLNKYKQIKQGMMQTLLTGRIRLV